MPDQMKLQPTELISAQNAAGLSFASIPSSQLLLVSSHVSGASLRCYEKGKTGIWRVVRGIGVARRHTGINGVTDTKKEGDGCTPSGFHPLGYAFGCRPIPETKLPYRTVTKQSFWVDDPSSIYYNTWVEGTRHADWASAERLYDYPDSYAYAVIIEYNTSCSVPGKGSAIFLHCGSSETSGCVAVAEHVLLKILRWLVPEKKPGILIF